MISVGSRKTVVVSTLCVALLSVSAYAAVNIFHNTEAEGGTIAGIAAQMTDSSASNGEMVKFGTTNGGCMGAAFTPDGPDPWGGCWPGPNSTGVPTGIRLSPYTGSCTITTSGTTIDARTVDCSPLTIRATNVTITNSQLNGGVNIESAYCGSASFTITDSSVDIPAEVTGGNSGSTGILRCNFTANRVDVTGGRRSMYCVTNCVIENSWVHEHGVDPQAVAHFSGIRMEQNATIRHNSITCEATRSGPGSGCSSGLTGYGDFAPIQDNLIERNMFYRGAGGGSTACAYGGSSGDDGSKPFGDQAENIQFISNRFVRAGNSNNLCGNLRTIIDFDSARPGNVWTDNLYDDGAAINPNGP